MSQDHLKSTPDQVLQKLAVLSVNAEEEFLRTRDKKWSRAVDSIAQAAEKIRKSSEFQSQRPK